jgi:hypothetical protein
MKSCSSIREENQKRYLCSNNLIKPTVIENININEMIDKDNLEVVFTKEIYSEYVGKILYKFLKN